MQYTQVAIFLMSANQELPLVTFTEQPMPHTHSIKWKEIKVSLYDMLLAIGAGLWNMICSYAPIVTQFGFCSYYGSYLGPLSFVPPFPHLLGALF
jgi:hypothetical protein